MKKLKNPLKTRSPLVQDFGPLFIVGAIVVAVAAVQEYSGEDPRAVAINKDITSILNTAEQIRAVEEMVSKGLCEVEEEPIYRHRARTCGGSVTASIDCGVEGGRYKLTSREVAEIYSWKGEGDHGVYVSAEKNRTESEEPVARTLTIRPSETVYRFYNPVIQMNSHQFSGVIIGIEEKRRENGQLRRAAAAALQSIKKLAGRLKADHWSKCVER